MQYSQIVNAWAGIVNDKVIGLYFIRNNLEYLKNVLIPALCFVFQNEHNRNIPGDSFWFQQYGALPHLSRAMRSIRISGSMYWSDRTSDLIPKNLLQVI